MMHEAELLIYKQKYHRLAIPRDTIHSHDIVLSKCRLKTNISSTPIQHNNSSPMILPNPRDAQNNDSGKRCTRTAILQLPSITTDNNQFFQHF
ncbi:hypothetical protein ABKN59_004298 [Abortiporus biennis]